MSELKKWCFVFLFSTLTFIYFPIGASAHTDNSEGYSNITFDEQGLRYELELDYLELSRLIDLGITSEATTPQMKWALENKEKIIEQYLQSNLLIYNHGALLQGKIVKTNVKRKRGRDYAHLVLHFPVKNPDSAAIQITYNVFFDDNDPSHRNIASYQLGDQSGRFVFNGGERNLQIEKETLIGQSLRFIQLGFHHILIGWDHILFIIALVITSRNMADVWKVMTLFTLAHSVTIGLTALDVLSIPAVVIEPLIALSIMFVAIENFLGFSSIYRYGVVFIFGLIHGVGFAGALHIFQSSIWESLLPIITFNVGVEAGQALIIATLFPLLLLIRKYKWAITVHGMVNALIFIIGLTWYFQRVFV
ncbi:Hydrogenase/urease accessory protein HupE [Thalassobacillus cyri]|uniref:Hydrogenase/urease accessory protein HupE n=1 Tax=Thalassobacillus cyri TaxID=571932 RepID=A0A1H3W0D1_9BACI|nr:HupE/UreJ family protein [Thalassobacillus cyri]SDZ80430.1 Hydrogenase/urease accessory protein HupE [Thalassobacillus cyri]